MICFVFVKHCGLKGKNCKIGKGIDGKERIHERTVKIVNALRSFIFCCILCQFVQVNAQVQDQITYPLYYTYRTGDDAAWAHPEYDDRDWLQVKTATFPHDAWQGIGWFRYLIEVDSTLSGVPLGISVAQRGAAEIYLNGKRLYQLGTVGSSKEEKSVFSILPLCSMPSAAVSSGGRCPTIFVRSWY